MPTKVLEKTGWTPRSTGLTGLNLLGGYRLNKKIVFRELSASLQLAIDKNKAYGTFGLSNKQRNLAMALEVNISGWPVQLDVLQTQGQIEVDRTKPISLRASRLIRLNPARARSDREGSRHDGKIGDNPRLTALGRTIEQTGLQQAYERGWGEDVSPLRNRLKSGVGEAALTVAEVTETGLIRLWTGKASAIKEPPEAFTL